MNRLHSNTVSFQHVTAWQDAWRAWNLESAPSRVGLHLLTEYNENSVLQRLAKAADPLSNRPKNHYSVPNYLMISRIVHARSIRTFLHVAAVIEPLLILIHTS
jgi:hypothetical protein